MDQRPSGAQIAAVVFGVLAILLGLLLAAGRWPMLWDPCHTWDEDSTSGFIDAEDRCRSQSSTTETRTEFVLWSLAAEGVLLAGGLASIWQSLQGRRWNVAFLGLAMLSPTAVLFRGVSALFVVAFLLGVGLATAALLMPARRLEAAPPAA